MSGWTQEDVDRHLAQLREPHATSTQPAPAPDVLEAPIQLECTRLLECDGWRALRTDPVSRRSRGTGFGEIGMADYMYIRYLEGGDWSERYQEFIGATDRVIWVEWKRGKGGVVSKAQRDWHTKERARGAVTIICGEDFPASVDGFKAWYRASGLMRIKSW